jgi:hypothetical protein
MARKVSLITYDEHTGYTMEVSSLRVKPEETRGTIVCDDITADAINTQSLSTRTLNVSSMVSISSLGVDKSIQIFGNGIKGDVLSVNGNVRFVSNDKDAVDVTVKDGHIYADTLHARCITAKSGEGNQLINADNIEASYVETKTLSVELLDGALFDKGNVNFITIKNNRDPQTLLTTFPGTVLESCSDYKLVSTQQGVSGGDTPTLGFSCNENSVIVGKWRAIMAVGIVKEVAWRGVVYLAVRMSY